jgi:hypothetical protein
LQVICDRLGPTQIETFVQDWLRVLPTPLSDADEAAGYWWELSMRQVVQASGGEVVEVVLRVLAGVEDHHHRRRCARADLVGEVGVPRGQLWRSRWRTG